MAHFEARRPEVRLRKTLGASGFQLLLSTGMMLFCLGLLFISQAWWESVLWGLLAAASAVHAVSLRGQPRTAKRASGGAPSPPAAPTPGLYRRLRWLGWGFLVAGVLLLGGWGILTAWQLLDHSLSLRSHLNGLEALARGGASELALSDLEGVGHHLAGMHQDLAAIESQVGPLMPFARLLRWVPEYGGDLAAAPDLLQMATGLAAAGDRTFRALSPAVDALAAPQDAPGSPLAIGPELVAAGPELEAASRDLDAASQARARVDAQTLSPKVAGLLERVDRYLPWIETALDSAVLAPDLLGTDDPRTFLILAQNNHELRATGGFVSGVGVMQVEGGEIRSLQFGDSYAVDNLEVPHDVPPAGFRQTLYGDLWLFRDTNWDADFPMSARRALRVYARDRGVQADGLIALDLTALRLLLEALGPIQIEGMPEPVTGANVVQMFQTQWANPSAGPSYSEVKNKEWWLHRKDFMGQVASAGLDKLLSGQGVEMGTLAQSLKQALDEKHILAYLDDPQAASLLRERNWDGALSDRFSTGDALLVVDSNVGFNKVDGNVTRSIDYRVDLTGEGRPRARLALTYSNHSTAAVQSCIQESRYGDTYADMTERCYWDYVRVYVPQGSKLLVGPDFPLPSGSLLARNPEVDQQPTISPTLSEGGRSVWAAFFDLAPGEERTLVFEYELPGGVLDWDAGGQARYSLYAQKQPGTEAVTLNAEFILPAGADVVRTEAATRLSRKDGRLRVATNLRTDRAFEIVFREGD